MNKVYLLLEHNYYYYDEKDKEDVEDKYIIGFFLSEDKLNFAIDFCINKGIDSKKLKVEIININFTKHQKYFYVLHYEYSIINDNNEYEDYFYFFNPCTSKKDCLELKSELLQNKKYQKEKNKIYDCSTDGFYVCTYKIDKIGHIPNI